MKITNKGPYWTSTFDFVVYYKDGTSQELNPEEISKPLTDEIAKNNEIAVNFVDKNGNVATITKKEMMITYYIAYQEEAKAGYIDISLEEYANQLEQDGSLSLGFVHPITKEEFLNFAKEQLEIDKKYTTPPVNSIFDKPIKKSSKFKNIDISKKAKKMIEKLKQEKFENLLQLQRELKINHQINTVTIKNKNDTNMLQRLLNNENRKND